MQKYNSKIIRFENHIEIIRYGKSRIRAPSKQNQIQYFSDKSISDEESRKQRLHERAFSIKRKIKYYCLANEFDLFWTLTLNDNRVNAKNYEYSRKRLQAWLKYQREKYGKFDFLFIPELHPTSGRIHFHGLTGGLAPPLVVARSPKNNQLIKKKGQQIYNAENWKDGFSTVSMIQDRKKTASYISKYLTKELLETPSAFHQPRYFVSRGLKQPEISYELLPNSYYSELEPSFVTGGINQTNQKFEADISIYQMTLAEDGELSQDFQSKTVWKIKQKKSPDGNQDLQK